MADDKPFFLTKNESLGIAEGKDDLLHPASFAGVTDDSATETQYFGFSVPEARIHALCYLWHRPNLGIVTGGVWVWQGIKPSGPHAEMMDIRTFMKDTVLENDLHEYRLVNGYGVKILEPMKKFHMTYSDEARGNHIDLIHEAISPAVMFGDGNHFEQGMKITGKLVLRGKEYEVNSTSVRDRSWGKPRPEYIMPVAPLSWCTAVFPDGTCLNANVSDQIEHQPELEGSSFGTPAKDSVNGGWIYKDGKVGRVVSAVKKVARAPGDFHLPAGIELTITDEFDRTMHMSGTLVASCPWETWANVDMSISLMRWECDGMVTYGDCQEALWSDYLHYMANR
jgi:hypothetical protein